MAQPDAAVGAWIRLEARERIELSKAVLQTAAFATPPPRPEHHAFMKGSLVQRCRSRQNEQLQRDLVAAGRAGRRDAAEVRVADLRVGVAEVPACWWR